MGDVYVQKLVKARLKAIPPNISFSIGSHGDFTRDELIKEVEKNTPVGKEMIQLELRFIRDMPQMVAKLKG